MLLDLDGTLIDPRRGVIASIQYALERLGQPVSPAADLLWMIGPPLRLAFPKLLGRADITEAAIAHYREHYLAGGMYQARVYAGIPEALEALARGGCRLILATSKPHHYARPILEHFALADRFAAIHGPELDGRRDAKTELIAYVLAAHRLDAKATVMIGDRDFDVLGARNNGLASIGVAWGYGSVAELKAAGASSICEAPCQLAAAVLASALRDLG